MRSIPEFFAGRVVFMTGATGFLGKALVEKILRDAPGLERLYLLVRPGTRADGTPQPPDERLWREIFETSICARLRQSHGERFDSFLEQKVTAVAGDVAADGLGMERATRVLLEHEVDTVIHSAASVVFDERIDRALELNTRGAERVARFARSLKRPSVLTYISTAYVSGKRTGRIPEELLPEGSSPARLGGKAGAPGLDVAAEIEAIDAASARVHEQARALGSRFRAEAERAMEEATNGASIEALEEEARQRWLGTELVREGMRRARRLGWHDVYTFTKAMGERLVRDTRGDLPVAVVRPSIIESSLAEPEPGWINGLKVADPLIAAYAKGRLPDFPCRRDVRLDFIPVDFVVNATLAATERTEGEGGLRVHHVSSGHLNPVRLGEVFDLLQVYYRRHPMRDRKGEPIRAMDWKFPTLARFKARYRYGVRWPLGAAGWIMDKTGWLGWPAAWRKQLARGVDAVDKLLYYTDLYGAYTNLDCIFDSSNTKALWDGLGAEDRKTFPFDVESIHWPTYVQEIHLKGLDRHVLRFGSGARRQTLSEDDLRVLPDLVRMSAERFSSKVALQIKRDGEWERLSYRDLLKQAGLMGALWRREGLERGDRMLLLCENQPAWSVAYWAAQSVGATVVPLDTHTPPGEVEQIVEFTEARALAASVTAFPLLSKSLVSSPLRIWNVNDRGLPFAERGGPSPDLPGPEAVRWEELSAEDVATIIFTSGPAVDPRGVMLTHRNFLANLLALSEVLRSYETDRFVSVLPLHHALEFTGGLLMPLLSGALVTYATTLKSRDLLQLMEETGATDLLAVPRIFELLYDRLKGGLEQGADAGRRREVESFVSRTRLLVSGGAPLDHSISEAFASIGTPIHEGYGLTETSPILTVNPLWGIRPRSVGKPLPGVELKLEDIDSSGEGEIVVRGPNVTKGYYKNPEATAKLLRDGWLWTGDLGRLDADGYLTITGRSKELIVTGAGKNVWPEEIELFYRGIEGVEELAVFGVRPPGATRESVHAAVRSSAPEDVVRDAMHKVSRQRPTYQRIQQAHFWREPLPRTSDARFDRKLLRQRALEEHARKKVARRPAEETSPDTPWWERDTLELITRVAARPPDDPVRPRESLSELLDSLQSVELLASLESRFGLQLSDADVEGLERVEDVLGRIKSAVAERLDESRPPSAEPAADGSYWATMIAEAAKEADGDGRQAGASAGMEPFQDMFLAASGLALRTGWRHSVRGLEKLPLTRPFLVAANHSSHFDTTAMLTALRGSVRRVYVLGARDYFFDTRLKAWFFRNFLNVVPFDRDRNFVAGFRTCRQVLQPSEPVLLFPEGTRSMTGRLQPFKVGLGILALELGTPVVPARIRGTYEALPKGRSWPRLSRIDVAFGDPVEMEPYLARRGDANTYELYREVVNEVRQRIERLIEEG